MRFSIGNKIFSAFGLVFGAFIIFGVLMYMKAEEMRETSIERIQLSTLKTQLQKMLILHYIRLNEMDNAIHNKALPSFLAAYDECPFTKWKNTHKFVERSMQAEFDKLDVPHKELHARFEEMVSLLKTKEFEKAREVYQTTINKSFKELVTAYAPLYEDINKEHSELIDERDSLRESLLDEMKTLLLLALVVTLALIVIFYLWLKRSVISPISQITGIAQKISTGDAQQSIVFSAQDEIGDLANAFRKLINYMSELSDVAHKIGEGNLNVNVVKRSENDILGKALDNMLANINAIMFELKHSVLSLNSAASEILATTTQVSASASQTSSAVAQTSSSIEQIKQTAKSSSAKAVQTSESTSKAMEIAKSGTQGLVENMQGLAQIKEKMDLIASNIILLSQQSQQIGEITSTVEDIANQSNMLAVNASIEAVKAGEQGKGFSVVAIELKNLSEQSKQGAKQVQKILADIQKVTGTLVMVAEQGAKAVESGVKQAQNAKTSMDQLNATVQSAANAGKQIAASYEQELAGMDQISGAMSSVKEATMQNLSSIKQVEESAHDLNALSQKLKEVMEHYTIAENQR